MAQAPGKGASQPASVASQRRTLENAEPSAQEREALVPAAVGTVLLVLLAMPFVRPFRWKAMLFTYVIPIIPLAAVWDGTVSCMRTYSPAEMLEMARSVTTNDDYEWSAGLKRTWSSFMPVSYLVGVPRAIDDPSK